MSPEKIAIAVAVTIAAIAGIGAMKNVTGTSSAMAIVAVRPGTAPTNSPYTGRHQHHQQRVGIEHHPGGGGERAHRQKAKFVSAPQGSGTRSSL